VTDRNAVRVVRVRGGTVEPAEIDLVAAEEPLEVRLHGRPFAVIMRTPGADRELAAGFLLAERVIRTADDLGTIEYCTQTDEQRASTGEPQRSSNVVNVTLVGQAGADVERTLAGRRNVVTGSSCGLCGRQTIESLAVDVPPLDAPDKIAASTVATLAGRLRATQTVFDDTGGLHAAGLFGFDGTLVDAAEDVGRHNAVDKVVGRRLLREQLPLSQHALVVSGRTSYEIVQKALFAGVPVVAAVSAPSSLAVDLAEAFGITLIGFARGDSFNIYTHAARIE
jgi:FdhD protein